MTEVLGALLIWDLHEILERHRGGEARFQFIAHVVYFWFTLVLRVAALSGNSKLFIANLYFHSTNETVSPAASKAEESSKSSDS